MDESDSQNWLRSGGAGPRLLLAHGAGAPMDSEFLERLTQALSAAGVQVWRFEFSYMALRRDGLSRRPPPGAKVLLAEWRAAINAAAGEEGIFIGGKSMGGRMASMLAANPQEGDDRLPINGCLCFGYPFHPPGKPDRWRTEHLAALAVPAWIGQGERDPFGRRERVTAHISAQARAWPGVAVDWIPEGDHDFRPPKRSPATWESNLKFAADQAAAFIFRHAR